MIWYEHIWLEGQHRCVECGAFIGDKEDALRDRLARAMRHPTLDEIRRRVSAPPLDAYRRGRRIGA